jgi:hypothetical protein
MAYRDVGLAAVMIVLLAVQDLLGTWLNLWVRLHDTSSDAGVYPAMFASVAGSLHTIFGALIGANAILMIARVWGSADRRLRWTALAVLLFVALAAYSGYHFVVTGGDNAYSFLMEFAFAGAFVTESMLLVLLLGVGVPAGPGRSPSAAVPAD